MLSITILCDNVSGQGFYAEHGLSFFIRYNRSALLFDTGATDIYLKNAQKLNIDIDSISTVVLSHGHWDHGDGLEYIQNKTLICHPGCFIKRYRKKYRSYLGLKLTKKMIEEKFILQSSVKPVEIAKDIIFLGEIPRNNHFESKETDFEKENGEEDFVMDDSALVVKTEKGLVVISGCAHAGICNTIEHAIRVTGENKIHTVIGGFHLKKQDEQTFQTIEYFEEMNITNLFPSHCTRLPALALFYEKFKNRQITTGMVIRID